MATSLAPPDMKKLEKKISVETQHVLNEMDDNLLLEDIRDILCDTQKMRNDANLKDTESDDYVSRFLYRHYEASGNKRIEQRINSVLQEIKKQDNNVQNPQQPTKDTKTVDDGTWDQLTPQDYKQKQQTLRKSVEYIQIRKFYNIRMQKLLKKKEDLFIEASMQCADSDLFKCVCIHRIDLILHIYHMLMHVDTLWGKVPIGPLLTIEGKYEYGHQQMFNDFLHIKLYHTHHGDENEEKKAKADIETTKTLCIQFEGKYPCKDIDKCLGFLRHYRDRTNDKDERQMFYIELDTDKSAKTRQIMTDVDWIFQEECDKIHCYFLHSTIQFSDHDPKDELKANQRITDINQCGLGRSWSKKEPNQKKTKSYVGAREDQRWMDTFKEKIDIDDGYTLLMKHMGIFRWQSAHGFRTGQNRGLMHLRPKWKNFKEEALYNSYHPASKDNWNQTFRKSKIFCASFASQRVRTLSRGRFKDEVSDYDTFWKAKEKITLQEVVTLKLYTDFDKLQRELKKCFRWETVSSVVNKDDENAKSKDEDEKEDDAARKELENRLCEFFYWRVTLLTMLTKFGIHINEKHLVLYHGVNAKMILNPAETMAFYGPLSTTSSYHVAKTFATAKGMVLKITSQFPRLKFCTAFNASLISDYPEESEYLISFMYLRVMEVRTRPIVSDITNKELWKSAPLPSKTRVAFFSIHLFKQQMFSVSAHLEWHLIQFLKCQSLKCCENYSFITPFNDDIDKKQSYLSWFCCQVAHHPNALTKPKDWVEDPRNDTSHCNIMKILWTKFNLFRYIPNVKQVIKIDKISDGLKEFFLEKSKEKDVHEKNKYVVSFEKVLNVFPNAKEIHFINSYRFDDEILDKLLNIIIKQKHEEEERKQRAIKSAEAAKSRSNLKEFEVNSTKSTLEEENVNYIINNFTEPPTPGLEKVVFVYYNYEDVINENGKKKEYPETSDMFFDPNKLNIAKIDQLQQHNWTIKFAKNGAVGYKIRLYVKDGCHDHEKKFKTHLKHNH